METDVLNRLDRCLVQIRSQRTSDALYRRLDQDKELARVLGSRLRAKVINAVGRLVEADESISAAELAREKEELIGNVLNGNCVLFLGPSLTLGANYLDVYETLAQRLAEESSYTGASVELEHTDSLQDAMRISLDHIVEFREYYEMLIRMEKLARLKGEDFVIVLLDKYLED